MDTNTARWIFAVTLIFVFVTFVLPSASSVVLRPDWVLIKDYLAVFISWPFAVFLLVMIFMNKFPDAINGFIRNIKSVKAAGVEVRRQQIPESANDKQIEEQKEQILDELSEDNTNNDEIRISREQAVEILKVIDDLTFLYLSARFVENTKLALRYLYDQPVLKEYFLLQYQLVHQVSDSSNEKVVILNELITNNLVTEVNLTLKVTDQGERFLRFIGYLNT